MTAQALERVNELAHINTFHPNALPWEKARGEAELAFLSRVCFAEEGHEQAAVAYAVKELAQLAEIERHVSAVMSIVLSEVQGKEDPFTEGRGLHDALSCFASEELNHANAFYRYVRELGGTDFTLPDNLFAERLALFLGDESPYVKLAALCCTAYIGESLITVIERRTRSHDPQMQYFLSKLLHLHNLDEERHIRTDHWVIDQLIPSFDAEEHAAMRRIITATEELNFRLAGLFEQQAKTVFGLDYTEGNLIHEMQTQLGIAFSKHALSGPITKLDDAIDEETRALLERFSGATSIHV
ncbi:hypothetical protein [Kitasatospora sp. NPDC057541]|uniref:hypothetical protein n=1 Tax=unclassified Kitasatospora TaxID=2633591 RepID=UPI0036B113CA